MNTKGSREIKFRCFYNGKMYPVLELHGEDSMAVNGIRMHLDGLGERVVSPDSEYIEGVMQYTGLKDKNGREIYEGDLLAEINNISELKEWGAPLVVEFGEFLTDKDSWGLEHCTTGFILRYQDGESTGIHSKEGPYGFNSSAMLIVGNIYEHPNLLEQ